MPNMPSSIYKSIYVLGSSHKNYFQIDSYKDGHLIPRNTLEVTFFRVNLLLEIIGFAGRVGPGGNPFVTKLLQDGLEFPNAILQI